MDLSLYLITDSRGMDDNGFLSRAEAALRGGVTMVQLREKTLSTAELLKRAIALKKLCKNFSVPLIINDRLDIALAAGADGVHLGQNDMPVKIARDILGRDMIIGATAKTVQAAKAAEKDGADYFGIGAFFSTDTKSDAKVLTPAEVRAVTDSVKIPAVGIGGLDADNIDIISGTGVKGAAVSSAIMHAPDPGIAAEALLKKIREIK